MNPMAWRRKAWSEEEVLDSLMLSYPLTQYMFCSPDEGAAAVVICGADRARELSDALNRQEAAVQRRDQLIQPEPSFRRASDPGFVCLDPAGLPPGLDQAPRVGAHGLRKRILQRESPVSTKGEPESFQSTLARPRRFVTLERTATVRESLSVRRPAEDVPDADPTDVTVRRRPEAKVSGTVPVMPVVKALVTRQREVRHFVVLETGIIPMQEPVTELVLEAPGGLVRVRAQCRNGKAESVRVENLPSFAEKLDVPLEVEGFGTLQVDTAFGGDSFVVVDAAALGFGIVADEAHDLARTGVRISKAANEQLGFQHPELDRQVRQFLDKHLRNGDAELKDRTLTAVLRKR